MQSILGICERIASACVRDESVNSLQKKKQLIFWKIVTNIDCGECVGSRCLPTADIIEFIHTVDG